MRRRHIFKRTIKRNMSATEKKMRGVASEEGSQEQGGGRMPSLFCSCHEEEEEDEDEGEEEE